MLARPGALLIRPLDDRRRMDARRDGLRQVPQRPRRRRAVRRHAPGLHARRLLRGAHRRRRGLQRRLQGIPAQVLGGAGEHVRAWRGLGAVDVEGGGRGRVGVRGGPARRVDSVGPYGAPVPGHLRLRWSGGVRTRRGGLWTTFRVRHMYTSRPVWLRMIPGSHEAHLRARLTERNVGHVLAGRCASLLIDSISGSGAGGCETSGIGVSR